jgi:hypothetical protein
VNHLLFLHASVVIFTTSAASPEPEKNLWNTRERTQTQLELEGLRAANVAAFSDSMIAINRRNKHGGHSHDLNVHTHAMSSALATPSHYWSLHHAPRIGL